MDRSFDEWLSQETYVYPPWDERNYGIDPDSFYPRGESDAYVAGDYTLAILRSQDGGLSVYFHKGSIKLLDPRLNVENVDYSEIFDRMVKIPGEALNGSRPLIYHTITTQEPHPFIKNTRIVQEKITVIGTYEDKLAVYTIHRGKWQGKDRKISVNARGQVIGYRPGPTIYVPSNYQPGLADMILYHRFLDAYERTLNESYIGLDRARREIAKAGGKSGLFLRVIKPGRVQPSVWAVYRVVGQQEGVVRRANPVAGGLLYYLLEWASNVSLIPPTRVVKDDPFSIMVLDYDLAVVRKVARLYNVEWLLDENILYQPEHSTSARTSRQASGVGMF